METRFVVEEPVRPENLTLANFLELEQIYLKAESLALFERRAADAIAARGAVQAIQGFIRATWVVTPPEIPDTETHEKQD